jgi:NitT/TauT family transport system substrate-binding protein
MAQRRWRKTVFRRAVAALFVVPAMGLAAACGGGSDPASSPDATITLGFSAWPGWFPWQVAEEQGLFERNGVDVELKYFDSYTDSLNALATGNIDANSQTLNDTLASVSGGAEEKIVLVNDNSTGNDQIIAAKGIEDVADLKGRKVAAEQGTVDHYLLLLALKKAGLGQDDITFTPLPTDAAAAAFVAGKVDAVGAFAPFTTTALGRTGSSVIASSANFPGAIPDHLVVSAELVERRPDDVQALVATWFDTLTWIEGHPKEATTAMAKRAGVSPEDYASYDAGTSIFTLEQNVEAFTTGDSATSLDRQSRDIAAFLVDSGLTDTEPPLDGLLEPRFVQKLAEKTR